MLPASLSRAARSLEDRLALLHVPARHVPASEWESLPPSLKNTVPGWLRELLANHRLLGTVLEYRDCRRPVTRLLRLCGPTDLAGLLADGSLMWRLVDHGYFPFATESDGSVWVTARGDEPGPVFLLELPEWDGNRPLRGNGLVFAAEALEYVFASMAVSEVSYYSHLPAPAFVMWYQAPRAVEGKGGTQRAAGGRETE